MYPSVAAAFWPSVAAEEGVVRWPYLDNKGLVTVGMGILQDGNTGQAPPGMLALPWKIEAPGLGARKATISEIQAAWSKVKGQQAWKSHGGGGQEWADLTDIRLDDDAIRNATEQWLQQNEPTLRHFFPGYDTMPADAQLALLGMSYAMGSAFAQGYPKLRTALNAVVADYAAASQESAINKNVTKAIADHNATNAQLFLNAAAAQRSKTPFSVVWWPANRDPGASGTMAVRAPSAFNPFTAKFFSWKRLAIAAAATAAGALGVSMGISAARGKGWVAPIRGLEKGALRFGRGVDSSVKQIARRSAKG